MDSPLMRIFSIIISVVIFFIFPVYITFEKKDDIAYSMATKATYDFAENVSNKGFISEKMYQKLVSDLSATNNSYQIEITHRKKRYDPVIYIYTNDKKEVISDRVDYILNKDNSIYFTNGKLKANMSLNSEETEVIYTTEYILSKIGGEDYLGGYRKGDINRDGVINSKDYNLMKNYNLKAIAFDTEQMELADLNKDKKIDNLDTVLVEKLVNADYEERNKGIYLMDVGDEMNVKIRNTNTTIATVMYNTFTLGAAGTNLRVFANLSTVIKNEAYMTKY